MNALIKGYYRIVQLCFRLAMPFLSIPVPKLISSIDELANALKENGLKKPLLVTGSGSTKKAGVDKVQIPLNGLGFDCSIYPGAIPDPDFNCIEEGARIYKSEGCDCLIALGGGSPIDCAKGIAIKSVYPKKRLSKFKGVLHVHRQTPVLIAIPTTVGSGSEATLAAVIVDSSTHDKFQIDDPKLVPSYALLNPRFVLNMPKKLIASTGMDALTHAIESFIGKSSTKFSRKQSLEAIALIKGNLLGFYADPSNEMYASNMQIASYKAGLAFTRAYVGYVHALAHSLGGYYDVPHGYANAVLLPIVLENYGKKAEKKLSQIYDCLGFDKSKTRQEKSKDVIDWIKKLNSEMGIPSSFGGIVSNKNYAELSLHACKEGNPLYPVPEIWSKEKLEEVLRKADE